jgi:hypothetical protein
LYVRRSPEIHPNNRIIAVPFGAEGKIISDDSYVRNGYRWWNVQYDTEGMKNIRGWSAEGREDEVYLGKKTIELETQPWENARTDTKFYELGKKYANLIISVDFVSVYKSLKSDPTWALIETEDELNQFIRGFIDYFESLGRREQGESYLNALFFYVGLPPPYTEKKCKEIKNCNDCIKDIYPNCRWVYDKEDPQVSDHGCIPWFQENTVPVGKDYIGRWWNMDKCPSAILDLEATRLRKVGDNVILSLKIHGGSPPYTVTVQFRKGQTTDTDQIDITFPYYILKFTSTSINVKDDDGNARYMYLSELTSSVSLEEVVEEGTEEGTPTENEERQFLSGECVPILIHPSAKINYVFVYYGRDDDMKIFDMSFKEFIEEGVIGNKDECCGLAYVEPYASHIDKFNFYYVNKPMKKPYYLYPPKDCTEELRKKGLCAEEGQKAHIQVENIYEVTKECDADYIAIIDSTEKSGGGAVLTSYIYYAGTTHNLKENALTHVHEFSHIIGNLGDEYFFAGGDEISRNFYCPKGKCMECNEPNVALTKKEAYSKWRHLIAQGEGCLKVLDPAVHKVTTWELTGGHLLPEYFHATSCSIMNFYHISDKGEYDWKKWSDSRKKAALSTEKERSYGDYEPTLSYEQIRHGLGPVSEVYIRKKLEVI